MKTIVQPSSDPFAGNTALATFGYDDLGRRTSLSRANGTSTSYSYDAVSRLSQLVQNPAGTTHDLTLGFSYNPASQITSNTRSNDSYAWTGHGNGTLNSPANGRNQLVSHNGSSVSHDAKGNVTFDPTTGYNLGYSSENLLTSVSGSTWSRALSYDPLMRLYQPASVRFGYDGEDRIAEYNGSGTQTLRFVHGPGVDEPLIEYSGTGLATRKFLHADERGSIIAASDNAGTVTAIGKYDEYGRTQSSPGRFGYAGKPYETLSELYYSRARMYNQRLPRFPQPDPIGYGDGMNIYNRTKGDPVNLVDPSGLCYAQRWTMHVYTAQGRDLGPDPVRPESGVYFVGCSNAFAGSGSSGGDGGFNGSVAGPGGSGEFGSGGDGVYRGQTPQQQRINCRTNPAVRRALNTKSVQSSIERAFNLAFAAPTGFWEYGFWTAEKSNGSGVHAFSVGTDRLWNTMFPENHLPWGVTRWWYGTGMPNVFLHTHSGEPLSEPDVRFADNSHISIIALNPSGNHYCYPG